MGLFFDDFTNREKALFIWTGIFVIILLLKAPGLKKPLTKIFKIIFGTKVSIILIILCSYVYLILYAFYKLGVWDLKLLKSTIFWFFGNALVLFYHTNEIKNTAYFKKILKNSFKWMLLIEFLSNLYCFSLPVEIFILPILLFLLLAQAFAEKESKYKEVNNFLSKLISIVAIIVLIQIFYKTATQYSKLFTIDNLKDILLAPTLTILYFPFIYILALYFGYTKLFIQINFRTNDLKQRKILKKQSLLMANVSLNKLNRIIIQKKQSEKNV